MVLRSQVYMNDFIAPWEEVQFVILLSRTDGRTARSKWNCGADIGGLTADGETDDCGGRSVGVGDSASHVPMRYTAVLRQTGKAELTLC